MRDGEPLAGNALDDLLDAILEVAGELDLRAVLERFVQVSARLTGARYGAIDVRDTHGTSTTFVRTGVPGALARALREGPQRPAVLGELPVAGSMRLADLRNHPSFRGFPADLAATGTFLGATVHVGARVYGHLYLSDKPETFTRADEKVASALAAAAGVAIANAQLYAEAERRESWLRAEQEITTMLLEGVDDEQALVHIATTALAVGGANTAALALPGVGGELLVELAVGQDAGALVGTLLPPDSRAGTVLTTGEGLTATSLREARQEGLRAFGPALFAPLRAPGRGIGVLVLLRRAGGPLFDDADLATAASFAAQAGLAYVLAEARTAQDAAALLDQRERIARDLHDLAIQQLFATGMQLETVRRRAARGVDATELTDIVADALENVDSSVRQIRHIVHELRDPDPDADVGLAARLHREEALACTGLGFVPALELTLDGADVPAGGVGEDRLDERVEPALSADLVAVVREGLANAARHAQASAVTVRVAVRGTGPAGEVRVEVQDDGVGVPRSDDRRSGTSNLDSRARARGGTFALVTRPDGRGALLTWSAPLA